MSCNENLRARKRRNEFPFPDPSEPSIARVLALHFLQGGGRKRSERVQRRIVDEALTRYRSGSSSSLSPLLSSTLCARLACPPFGVLFSEGRLTYRFREGSGHQGWCSLAFAVVSAWSKSDVASSTGEKKEERASFRLACRFPPIGQSMRFSLSRPTWLNLEIRVCALWLVLIFGHCGAFVTVWYRISIFNGGEKWMMRVLKSMIL